MGGSSDGEEWKLIDGLKPRQAFSIDVLRRRGRPQNLVAAISGLVCLLLGFAVGIGAANWSHNVTRNRFGAITAEALQGGVESLKLLATSEAASAFGSPGQLRNTLKEGLKAMAAIRHQLHRIDEGDGRQRGGAGPEPIIPFYVYKDAEIDELMDECRRVEESSTHNQGSGDGMAELVIIRLMEQHPWRVADPKEALVHVIPWPLGNVFAGNCGNLTVMEEYAARITATEAWKTNGGNDHIYISTHHATHNYFRGFHIQKQHKKQPKIAEVLQNAIWGAYIVWERNPFCTIPVPFWSEGQSIEDLDIPPPSIDDYVRSRPYDSFFMGRFFSDHHAGGYTTRRALWKYEDYPVIGSNDVVISTDDTHSPQVVHQLGSDYQQNCSSHRSGTELLDVAQRHCFEAHNFSLYASLASRSKYHLHVRGDDWTSRRLFESLTSGSLIVALSDGLFDKALPFHCEIDWENVLIQIGELEFRRDPLATFKRRLPNAKDPKVREDLQVRLNSVYETRRHLWYTENSELVSNVLKSAVRTCFPEAYLRRWNGTSGAAVRSLRDLSCPYGPFFNKALYIPRRHGLGQKQEGWRADD